MRILCWLVLFQVGGVMAQEQGTQETKALELLTFRKMVSVAYEGYQIRYEHFKNVKETWVVPTVFAFSRYRMRPETLKKSGFSDQDRWVFDIGFSGYWVAHPTLFIGMGAKVPLGYERVREYSGVRRSKFLIGLGLQQGVRWVASEDWGLVLGVHSSQYLMNSEVTRGGIRWEFEVGIQF